MKNLSLFFRSLYIHQRTWLILIGFFAGFIVAYLFAPFLRLVELFLLIFILLVITDIFLLYRKKNRVFARRSAPERLSNGDHNSLTIFIESAYPFVISADVIDEIPYQFQRRDVRFPVTLLPNIKQNIDYSLRPVERGTYTFGAIHVYVSSPLRLITRRFSFHEDKTVAVYPSFLQMRQYALMAVANRLNEAGIRRIRRVGASMEFDQIRNYVSGDDPRTINWKASARRSGSTSGNLMVNAFQDEKAQSVYCLIDKGRVMQSPFDGLALLDYAINSTLVLSNIVLQKQDKAGLITFAERIDQVVMADRRSGHLQKLLETLYHQETNFLETDYERLHSMIYTRIRQRSLLLLFTNFETLNSLRHQLPFLRKIARQHLLVVIFFENTETKDLLDTPADSVESIYLKTIAERFQYEKKQIVLELRRYGIQVILTQPKDLSSHSINKYLELKARGAI